MRFSYRMVPEVYQVFWAGMAAGEFINDAASSDLSAHSADDLDCVAAELNDRPRKRLGFKKPIEQIGPLLLR